MVHCVKSLFTTIELVVQISKTCIHDFPQQCMQDLMDGFFPSELQARYPDGVPFEVQALHSWYPMNLFNKKLNFKTFIAE